jgi:uncharacterized protein YecT (DUF1311 family)
MSIHVTSKLVFLAALVVATTAQAQERKDPCNTDLSIPLDAYLCSEKKLASATAQMSQELAATLAALPKRSDTASGSLVTKGQLQSAQGAWSTYVAKHCAFVADLPGKAADWHSSVANANFCRLAEVEKRTEYLRKWHSCAVQGGGVCSP